MGTQTQRFCIIYRASPLLRVRLRSCFVPSLCRPPGVLQHRFKGPGTRETQRFMLGISSSILGILAEISAT